MLEESLTRIIQNYFKSQPDVQAVFLFGSQAKNSARPMSDIDLAASLDSFAENSLTRRLQDTRELSGPLDREADIIFLDEDGPARIHQILRYGLLLSEKNHHRTTDSSQSLRNEYCDSL